MSIFRVEHKKNYTVVNNFICKDSRLSWKAKGIWLYAFSRPDDWQFHIDDLINQSTDGREAVRSGLKELEKHGYLAREQKRENGQFGKADWVFYEVPQENLTVKEIITKAENPSTVKLPTENHPLLSTDKILNTEKKERESVAESSAPPPPKIKPMKKQIGQFVQLSDDELNELQSAYGKEYVVDTIERINLHCLQEAKTYKNYSAAIRNWIRRDKQFNYVFQGTNSQPENQLDEPLDPQILKALQRRNTQYES